MFHLYSTDDGRVQPFEYLPAGAIVPKLGMALYMTGGKLAVAAGANKATYVSMTERDAAVEAGTVIPVVKIQKDQVWEVEKSDATKMTEGTGYDVAAGGLKLAGTTTTGNFIVTQIDDQTANGIVRGRFTE